MLTLLIFSILLSILFFYLMNPLSLGLILILQTISVSLMLGTMSKSFWFLYLLILVFIGGMLVLFIYVTSIFPNEKFLFNQNVFLLLIAGVLILSTSTSLTYFFNLNIILPNFKSFLSMGENLIMTPTIKIFISQTNFLLIFLVNYLFYCMIVVIKVTNFFQGPLRKMNYV
uniref:NADH dehydrogenase subunit 6 n=1 Tax=Eolachesilla chilensis TaxID=297977 RepID=A0A8K1ZFF3_9NEOP|nr:NADH dehydrogenase subunit 6 [Eolachesilla chilensis]